MAVEDWTFVSEDGSDNASVTDSDSKSGSRSLEFDKNADNNNVVLKQSTTDAPTEGRVVFNGKFRSSWNGSLGVVFGYTDPQNWYGLHLLRAQPNSDASSRDVYVLLTQMSDGEYSRLDIEHADPTVNPENWHTYSLTFWHNNDKLMTRVTVDDDILGADLTANVDDESALAGGIGLCDHNGIIQNQDFFRAYSNRWWADDVEVYYEASN